VSQSAVLILQKSVVHMEGIQRRC